MPQHVSRQMGQNHALAPKLGSVRLKRSKIQVILNLLFEKIGLSDKQIGAFRRLEQRVSPLRVAGVGDHPPAIFDPHSESGRAASVLDSQSSDFSGPDTNGTPINQLHKINREPPIDL